jgi:hypothetical protein
VWFEHVWTCSSTTLSSTQPEKGECFFAKWDFIHVHPSGLPFFKAIHLAASPCAALRTTSI